MSGNRLQPHFVLLCERLDLDKLLPFLRQERMVTNDEYEILTNMAYTKKQQRERLLIILPRKGRHFFENFGKCLVWSGQAELAQHIGVDVDNVLPAPYVPPQATGCTTNSENNESLLETIQNLISAHTANGPDPPPPPYPPTRDVSRPSYQPPVAPPISLAPACGQHTLGDRQPPVGVGGASMASDPSLAPHAPYGAARQNPDVVGGASRVSGLPSHSDHYVEEREPGSVRVFILYCKDETLLQHYQTSHEEFVKDVLELADILVYCGGFQSCSADFYETDEQQNWDIWTQKKIEESTYVVMVCSPQLIQHLSQRVRSDVHMDKGMFFSDTVINCVMAPKFVPVFLNHCAPANPKDWMPPQLHAARYFQLRSLRDLYQDIHAQEYSDDERNQVLSRKLQDPKHKQFARLVGYLRKQPEVVRPDPPRIPVQLPPRSSPVLARHIAVHDSVVAEHIPEATFVKIAERIRREWVRLGVKLGVEYSTVERLRHKHMSDYVLAVLEMFRIWQHSKGREATKRALKRALVDMNFGRLAGECFADVRM